jgi:uncharacterized membrane protein HdeD (DUF308 family)
MTAQGEAGLEGRGARVPARGRRLRGALLLVMGCLAAAAVFLSGPLVLFSVGLLLIACGVLEMLETFRAGDEGGMRSAYFGGLLSVLAGTLLMAQPQLVVRGLALLLAASFLFDGIGKALSAARVRRTGGDWKWRLVGGLVNGVLALVLATRWPVSGRAVVALVVAVRMVTTGWAMLLARGGTPAATPRLEMQHPDARLGLPPRPEFAKLQASLQAEEKARRRIDAAWCWTFVAVFFAIHLGRMRVEWNLVGMISPLVAVIGDVGTALLLAFAIILPLRLAWRRFTRPLERRSWNYLLERTDEGRGPGLWGRVFRGWLVGRLRFSGRASRMRYSPRAALRWGLQVGLPATAILIAVNPIWGFSWFFNSESWATGVWDHWAAARTDTWRDHMIRAVEDRYRNTTGAGDDLFRVTPDGAAGGADFSFLVLGDTGEGGAAQHCLRDQYLAMGQRPDVRFLVIASDVIYPSGAMADYESKFYLPFKGFTKPIYAIPGNHDWYDALEGFAANFLEADAARACMSARVVADNRLTSTTESRIDGMIDEAARLRREFGVNAGWQRGPFFELQTERFALIAVDTGVLRRVETRQWQWLKSALDRARGKFTLVILGHPLYAGGRYQGGAELYAGEWKGPDDDTEVWGQRRGGATAPFAAIHELLRQHQVESVLAGDTHYFEYYREPYEAGGTARTMHHFVNGGGGAYLSIGTPLDWPEQPSLADCAYYPRKDFVIEKLDRETPAWKLPLWWWAKRIRGWPLTAEALAGAFVYGNAPYAQSFVEVRVEKSRDRVCLIAHGANGPLRWREMQSFGTLPPTGVGAEEAVEFVIPMTRERP